MIEVELRYWYKGVEHLPGKAGGSFTGAVQRFNGNTDLTDAKDWIKELRANDKAVNAECILVILRRNGNVFSIAYDEKED